MSGRAEGNKGWSFWEGVKEVSPLIVGVTPFGMICGAVCADSGMPEWAGSGLSVIIFAGASQLIATQLMVDHTSVAVVILTGLIINMRMFMYSASLAPHFRDAPLPLKFLLGYVMTDQAYAVSINRYSREGAAAVAKPYFYLGAAATLWIVFNISTVLGAYLGALIPPEWSLDFAIPLTFMALVVPSLKDRPALLAAMVAGIAAIGTGALPLNLGLVVSALIGIATGYTLDRKAARG